MTDNRIEKISIDSKSIIRSEKNSHLRQRAITDILEENEFELKGHSGPYNLCVEIVSNKFVMNISNGDNKTENMSFSLSPLRSVIKDYHIICESYYDAVKTADPRRTEAIDMGRRGVHNEGSEILEGLLDERISVDFETLRKLFSLIYVLQIK
ncbi:MAG: hypothetical protein COV35_10355 [Alphaproteobacteria bacterium CG11_big_fil_rev_8_21_14_0_20_39_49]|nr:MAG: hypothetical protein COV35_10355 [Alphaproteobacteria bacterium CG11_big_fil_rev_8_21_14_0_20_39_49]